MTLLTLMAMVNVWLKRTRTLSLSLRKDINTHFQMKKFIFLPNGKTLHVRRNSILPHKKITNDERTSSSDRCPHRFVLGQHYEFLVPFLPLNNGGRVTHRNVNRPTSHTLLHNPPSNMKTFCMFLTPRRLCIPPHQPLN